MLRLSREVRLSLDSGMLSGQLQESGANTWAGRPRAVTVSPYLVIRGTFEGEAAERTGYLVDIRRIDQALRRAALDGDTLAGQPLERAALTLLGRLRGLWSEPPELVLLELQTTPYLTYAVKPQEPRMLSVTQCFEFAASHRLSCPDFSEQRNREVFGKCSSPNGHGHNYGLEVTVRFDAGSGAGPFSLAAMEAVTKERVLDRFDHKHLNVDCTEFADLNPSVENIARVIWGLLKGRIEGAELANVRVWETGKTRADCSG